MPWTRSDVWHTSQSFNVIFLFISCRFRRLDMELARAMADFTSRVLQVRGLFDTDKTAGFAVSRGMADIASLDFFLGQTLSLPVRCCCRIYFSLHIS